MEVIQLEDVDQIHQIFKMYLKKPAYKYRGQSNSEWNLIPKAGRVEYGRTNDQEIFRQWKRKAVGMLPKSYNTEIEYLTVAQHTGLPTRLLDWSHNPLIALFFAVNENKEIDGAVFAYKPEIREYIYNEEFAPYKLEKDYIFFQPSSTINRLDNQFGHFSLHENINMPFQDMCESKNLTKIIIPSALKMDLLFMLNQYGINNLGIYPDLEGLSKHLKWFYENFDEWQSNSKIL